MANEIISRCQLIITKGSMRYVSDLNEFRGDMNGPGEGPFIGATNIPTAGVNIDLSQLTLAGTCRITNQDPTNYVEWGMYDGTYFTPLGELLPGQNAQFRLSRNLGHSYGSGTSMGPTPHLRFRAHTATCRVKIEVFEA